MPKLTILRKIDPHALNAKDASGLIGWLDKTTWFDWQTPKEIVPLAYQFDGDEHYYVDLAIPVESEMADLLGDPVIQQGFSVRDDDMKEVGLFRDLGKAEKAVGNAVFKLVTDITIDQEEPAAPAKAAKVQLSA